MNLADVDKDDVRVEGDTGTMRLPEPEILSSSLVEEKPVSTTATSVR